MQQFLCSLLNILFVQLLLFILLHGSHVHSTRTRPNIIYLLADDLGWNDVGYNNASEVYTPYVDHLANTGLKLTSLYTYTWCAPTRASLLTGLYNHRIGFQHDAVTSSYSLECGLRLNYTLISQVLQTYANYKTYILGKWHLGMYSWGYTPNFRGFDEFIGLYGNRQDYYTYENEDFIDFHNNTSHFTPNDAYSFLIDTVNTSNITYANGSYVDTNSSVYACDVYDYIIEQWIDEYVTSLNTSDSPFFYLLPPHCSTWTLSNWQHV